MKETLNSQIASGKRNFAFDMSPLDYIYSDTINMLMALNRRVLDVTGRLSLLAPQPEVLQILKRAGIHNILRIFDTETDLLKSSEDMILQTTSIKLSDVNDAMQQPPPPESEFDQLRSEIGSAFGDTGEDTQQAPSLHGRATGQEDEFNQMFQQLEPQNHAHPTPPQKPAWNTPPIQPQAPTFQPQHSPTSPPQGMPMRPASPAETGRTPDPRYTPEYQSVRSETQRFTSSPSQPYDESPPSNVPPPKKPLSFDDDLFDSSKKSPKGKFKDDFDTIDDDFDHDEFKKKSPFPMVVIILLVVILGGVGAYIASVALKSKTPSTSTGTLAKPEQTLPPTPPPQVPVDSQLTPPPPAVSESPAAPEKEIVESKPEVSKPPVRKSRPRRTTRRRSTPRVVKQPSVSKPVTQNQITFSSSPSGATITVNGKRVGVTPYTWSKPFFGGMNVEIAKSGYKTAIKSFEFTGGSMKESFSLNREVVKAPPPPPVKIATPKPPVRKPAPVASTPEKLPPPPPVDDDPFEDIGEEDDFALEPEPEPEPATPARTTSTTAPSRTSSPAAKRPVTRAVGGNAQIFIASIPPVADVFLGDQRVGKTNVSELKLPAGTHTLRFVKGSKEITKQITLKPGKNPSQMVRIP